MPFIASLPAPPSSVIRSMTTSNFRAPGDDALGPRAGYRHSFPPIFFRLGASTAGASAFFILSQSRERPER
jgi:hypothetical protein